MPKRFWRFIAKVAKPGAIFGLLLSYSNAKAMTWREIENNHDLKLSDGRRLVLRRFGDFDWHFTMKSAKGKILWRHTYRNEDLGVTWYWPFFVPIKPHNYYVDLNHDGKVEVAVAFWDGGNSGRAPVIVFTVEKNELMTFARKDDFLFENESSLFRQ